MTFQAGDTLEMALGILACTFRHKYIHEHVTNGFYFNDNISIIINYCCLRYRIISTNYFEILIFQIMNFIHAEDKLEMALGLLAARKNDLLHVSINKYA